MKFRPDPPPSHPLPPGQTYAEGNDKLLYIDCSSYDLKLFITSYAYSSEKLKIKFHNWCNMMASTAFLPQR